jgi:hypothetical protein
MQHHQKPCRALGARWFTVLRRLGRPARLKSPQRDELRDTQAVFLDMEAACRLVQGGAGGQARAALRAARSAETASVLDRLVRLRGVRARGVRLAERPCVRRFTLPAFERSERRGVIGAQSGDGYSNRRPDRPGGAVVLHRDSLRSSISALPACAVGCRRGTEGPGAGRLQGGVVSDASDAATVDAARP